MSFRKLTTLFGVFLLLVPQVFAQYIASDEDNLPNEFEIFRGQALNMNKEFVSSRGKVEFIKENLYII